MWIFSSLFLEIIPVVTNDPTISVVAVPIALLIVNNTGIVLTIILLIISLLWLSSIILVLGFKGDQMLRALRTVYAGLPV